jgi:predicted amidohydrolase
LSFELCEIKPPPLKVTVCQLDGGDEVLDRDWGRLVAHVHEQASDLVLLPEMPFCASFVSLPHYSQSTWDAAVDAHDQSERRLADLEPATVIGTRPIDFGNERYNSGFIRTSAYGPLAVHAQARLRCQEGAWESRWYHKATPDFVPVQAHRATIGFLIGPELWAAEEVRRYRDQAVNVLVAPRSAAPPHEQAWISAGRKAAAIAGAFVISSGRAGAAESGSLGGWIIGPHGNLLGVTSKAQPFLTASLDLGRTESARTESAKLGVDPEIDDA